jgi:hypothetical protein
MVFVDFQKHYDSYIFTDNYLQEIVDSQCEVFYFA